MPAADRVVELERENARLSADLASVKQQLDWFKRQLFGRKSEKCLDVDPAVQGNLLSALGVTTDTFVTALEKRDLMVSPIPPTRIRMVTHRHITASDVERAAAILAEVAGRIRR